MKFIRKAAESYNDRPVEEAIDHANVLQEIAVPHYRRGAVGNENQEECTSRRARRWRLSHSKPTQAYLRKGRDIDIEVGVLEGIHESQHRLPNVISFPPTTPSMSPPRSSSLCLRNARNTRNTQIPTRSGSSGCIAPQLKKHNSASPRSSTASFCFYSELDNLEPRPPSITGYATNFSEKSHHPHDNTKSSPALVTPRTISDASVFPEQQFSLPEPHEDLPHPVRYKTKLK
jgi:hypothetical protein